MSTRILIPTAPGDLHASVVAEALTRQGEAPLIWHTPDFPHVQAETVHFAGRTCALYVPEPGLSQASAPIDVVWNRRPDYRIDEAILHPSDVAFADASCALFRQSLFALLGPQAFWVNDDSAVRRNSKLLQHQAAVAIGLDAPDTVYTNDPAQIRAFLRAQGGRAVYKPLVSRCWWDGGDTYRATYTTLISSDDLVADELLQAVPGIYQALVPKAYELRVTVMGHHVTAARIRSQDTHAGKLDWRKAYGELVMEPYELPPAVAERCIALLRALGLVFGCFDFVVTPAGDYVFLEVNQAGQFLFIEQATGQPLLDMFCGFLRQARPDFTWTEPAAPIRLAQVMSAAQAAQAERRAEHVPGPGYAYREPHPSGSENPAPAAH